MSRKTNRPVTVAALMLALFMAAMEMTVVSTAMPTVIAELGGADHYAWVFTAYMLTSTVAVPIFGKLADLYGRKPVMLVAMALFLLGSMASGQARTMGQLVAFRAVQGIGAGGLQPMAITIVGDIFSIEERAKMQGIFGAVWAIAGLAGPLLGGIIVGALSWRWVFYVNVPFGIVSAILLLSGLVEEVERKEHRLDFIGAALLVVAVVALLLGVDGHAPFVLLPLSAIATVAFLVVERRVSEPIVPLDLFAQRTIATTNALMAIAGAAMIGLVTFVPLYAQGVLDVTPTEAGSTIAPMAIGWPIASAVSGGLIKRMGFRAIVRCGMGALGFAAVALALRMGAHAGAGELRILAGAFGVGMGFANTALIIAVQSSVGFAQRGVATSSTMFFRNIGGTVGVGVMGVVLARTLGSADLVAKILGPERRNLDPAILASVADDLARGVVDVTWVIAGLSIAAGLVAWLFPHVDAADESPSRA